MASLSQTAAARPVAVFSGRNSLLDRYFYFAMSLLMAGVVVFGFSHTINHNLLRPQLPPPHILWVHSAVFSGWIAFFIFQSALVRTRNVRLHRTMGWFGAGLGTVMIPLGIVTAVVMTHFQIHRLHQVLFHGLPLDGFLIVPLFSILVFGTFFVLAFLWRRKPEFHRRCMVLATCGLLSAAFARFPYLGAHHAFFIGVDLLVLLGAVRDLLVNRRVHAVYLAALPALVVTQILVISIWASEAHWWIRIADSIIG